MEPPAQHYPGRPRIITFKPSFRNSGTPTAIGSPKTFPGKFPGINIIYNSELFSKLG